MSRSTDRAAVRISPPLVFALAMGGGAAVQRWLVPLPALREPWAFAGGIMLLVAGGAFAAAALGLFVRTGQNPKPWTATPSVITGGVYRITRNPMYLGMALLQGGVGLLVGHLWVVLFIPPAMVVVYLVAIRHEEAYLTDKFGAEYLAYRARVRRWL